MTDKIPRQGNAILLPREDWLRFKRFMLKHGMHKTVNRLHISRETATNIFERQPVGRLCTAKMLAALTIAEKEDADAVA
jgi:hypothetical protein